MSFHLSKKNCLVLSIILGTYLELGYILKEDKFKYKGFIMSKIRSTTDKKRQKACKLLEKEFDIVKKKLPQLDKIKENTLLNTCQLLAQYFKVNIVIHELQKGDDYIDSIYLPNKREYDVQFARVDLLAKRVGDNLTGHVDVIHPEDWGYRRARGWACIFCPKVVHTHWERHTCTAYHVKNCLNCHRVLMKKDVNNKIYKKTQNIVCSSSLETGKIKCEDCYGEFKSDDCYKQQKKNQMCHYKKKCSKCNKWIRWFVKADREKAIKSHDCNKNII